jgi:hypothetical protein
MNRREDASSSSTNGKEWEGGKEGGGILPKFGLKRFTAARKLPNEACCCLVLQLLLRGWRFPIPIRVARAQRRSSECGAKDSKGAVRQSSWCRERVGE